jgi:hypothetical protein
MVMLTLFLWEAAANGVRILPEKNYQYSQKENKIIISSFSLPFLQLHTNHHSHRRKKIRSAIYMGRLAKPSRGMLDRSLSQIRYNICYPGFACKMYYPHTIPSCSPLQIRHCCAFQVRCKITFRHKRPFMMPSTTTRKTIY